MQRIEEEYKTGGTGLPTFNDDSPSFRNHFFQAESPVKKIKKIK